LPERRKMLRDFLFRGLMFEAEASAFQAAGIQVGADQRQAEERLFSEVLSPFGVPRRNKALEMSRLYALLHCFENEVRDLIRETLQEADGPDWIEKLPRKVLEFARGRQEQAVTESWLEGEKEDLLGFADFCHLATIIIEKWNLFEDRIPTQQWLKQRMDELEKARNFVAHHRVLLPSEFHRVYLYIADWNRQVGF
jgi:hypothetical protein